MVYSYGMQETVERFVQTLLAGADRLLCGRDDAVGDLNVLLEAFDRLLMASERAIR
jgi:hypothetical protein